jgi:hypothetical protein
MVEISTPETHSNNLCLVILTTKDDQELLAVSAYMPQRHTPAERLRHNTILEWLTRYIDKNHPHTLTLLGGDFQASPWVLDPKSYYAPSHEFSTTTNFHSLTHALMSTFRPAATFIDHLFIRQPHPLYPLDTITCKGVTIEYNGHTAIHIRISYACDPAPAQLPLPNNPANTTTSHPPF